MKYICSWCGKNFNRYESQTKGKEKLFCSRKCLAAYRSKVLNPEGYPKIKHPELSEYNRVHNAERMTQEVRDKLRDARLDTGAQKSYRKVNGRHEHRAVAESVLGRPLKKGEVVHHIDRNKRNNSPDNLMVFRNQAEHAKWHESHDHILNGGDAR